MCEEKAHGGGGAMKRGTPVKIPAMCVEVETGWSSACEQETGGAVEKTGIQRGGLSMQPSDSPGLRPWLHHAHDGADLGGVLRLSEAGFLV